MDGDTVMLTVVSAESARSGHKPSAAERDASRATVDRRSLFTEIETDTIRTQPERPTVKQEGSPLAVLTQADIQAFGFNTVQDVIRTLPQIFGGGPSEDTRQIGFEARTNAASGAGINLRGLGAGSTLVLVNGRRLGRHFHGYLESASVADRADRDPGGQLFDGVRRGRGRRRRQFRARRQPGRRQDRSQLRHGNAWPTR
jgi:hypothetical protein